MSHSRLNYVMVLSIYKELLDEFDELDLYTVAIEFVGSIANIGSPSGTFTA